MSLFSELKRRNVFRVGVAYVVGTWLLLQVTDVLGQILELPESVGRVVLFVLVIGFVPVLLFSWVYELTPEGVKKESEIKSDASIAHHTAKKLDYATIGLLIAAIVFVAINNQYSEPISSRGDEQPETTVADTAFHAIEPVDEKKSIAVLAFRDMSAAGDQDYFAEGIAEELLNALVRVKGLRVASRTSAFSYKGSDLGLTEIGQQLNVNHILEGSVRTNNDRIRVTAQLIDVNTDTHLWSEIYDRDSGDIFAVQADITSQVVVELKVHLGDSGTSDTVPVQLTTNTEAYRLYLRGRHLWRTRGRENLITAKSLFEQATKLDPLFSRAWSNLSVVNQNLVSYDSSGPVEKYATDSLVAMNKALEINPQNAEALTVKADSFEQQCQFIEADKTYKEAIAIDPKEPTSRHWYGLTLLELGQTAKAGEQMLAGYDIDPLISALVSTLGNYYEMSGDIENAIHYYREAADLGIYDGAPWEEGLLLAWEGEYAKAREMMLAGASAYGFLNLESIPKVLEALESGEGKEVLAKQLLNEANARKESQLLVGEYLALLNSPLYFDAVDRNLCGYPVLRLVWFRGANGLRSHTRFIPWLESIGYLDYFREYGWPALL